MKKDNSNNGTYKIASDVLAGGDLDMKNTPTLYEGTDYKIVGPLQEPFESIGVLIAKNKEKIDELITQRENFDPVKYDKDLKILNFILSMKGDQPQALVDMPPSNFVCMDALQNDEKSKQIVEKILKMQEDRGIYFGKLEARDFWIDTDTHKLFFVALHKLKIKE